jgi:Ca2+-binding RTX toxin-like protein
MALLQVSASDTITTNQITTDEFAIEYTADDVTLEIAKYVAVTTVDDDCISSINDGSALINNGFVAMNTGEYAAVRFTGANSSVVNNTGATILGDLAGIEGVERVTNHGDIVGLVEDGIDVVGTSTGSFELNNTGEVFGGHIGVHLRVDALVNNSGTIGGGQYGLFLVRSDSNGTDVINNEVGGRIEGGTAAISTSLIGSNDIDLDNRGTIDGDVDLNAFQASDQIVNRAEIIGDVFLGTGNDKFKGKGKSTSGDVFGEGGDDKLIGGKKDDTLDGGSGIDLLRGGKGKDSLFGGFGGDTFDFNSIRDSVRGSRKDTINDFERGSDEINLRTIDAMKGVSGNQKFKWINKNDFHDKKGELRYEDKGSKVVVQGDVNGDGKADFEILVKVGNLSDDDFVL